MRRMLNKSMKNFCLEVLKHGGSLDASTFAVESRLRQAVHSNGRASEPRQPSQPEPTVAALTGMGHNFLLRGRSHDVCTPYLQPSARIARSAASNIPDCNHLRPTHNSSQYPLDKLLQVGS